MMTTPSADCRKLTKVEVVQVAENAQPDGSDAPLRHPSEHLVTVLLYLIPSTQSTPTAFRNSLKTTAPALAPP